MKLRGLWYGGMYGHLCSTIKNSDLVRHLLKARMWRSHMGPSSPNPSLVKHSLLLVIAPPTRCALFPDCDAPWRDTLEKNSDQHNEMYYVNSKKRYSSPDIWVWMHHTQMSGEEKQRLEMQVRHFISRSEADEKIWLLLLKPGQCSWVVSERSASRSLKIKNCWAYKCRSRYKIWQINRKGEGWAFSVIVWIVKASSFTPSHSRMGYQSFWYFVGNVFSKWESLSSLWKEREP